MTTLDLSFPGELRLTLRGATENPILDTLRHWPHWLSVEVERDPADQSQCRSVTLIAERGQEATLREVLRRSFGMIFPPEGGDQTIVGKAVPTSGRRGLSSRRG